MRAQWNHRSNTFIQFHTKSKMNLLRNATRTLRNLCHDKPRPLFSVVNITIRMLASIIEHKDEKVLVDAC